jgi:putative peptidoglycan lipid II flippase
MLFEHGLFTAADTIGTAHALMLLALALPAHVLVKALSPAFFARGDTLTPLMATLGGFAVAIVLGIVLGHVYGAGGIAASIALGAWVGAFTLVRGIAAGFGFSIDDACRRRLPRIGGAALVMGGLLWAATHFALAQNAGLHDLAQAAALLVLIVGGMAIYGLLLSLLGVTGWREALGAIRQTPPGDLRV